MDRLLTELVTLGVVIDPIGINELIPEYKGRPRGPCPRTSETRQACMLRAGQRFLVGKKPRIPMPWFRSNTVGTTLMEPD